MQIDCQGERLRLLLEQALFWERRQTLVVADAHWGKAASFRAAAIAVPGGTTADDLARLTEAIERMQAGRLVLLGDLFHAKTGREARNTLLAIQAWRQRHPELDILLVRGNHDRHAGDPPEDLGIRCVDGPVVEPPFVWQHEPGESSAGYVLAGHIHPAVTVAGRGKLSERLPCFWFGDRAGVLPAFGSFTGTATVHPDQGDRVYAIAGDEVLDVSSYFGRK